MNGENVQEREKKTPATYVRCMVPTLTAKSMRVCEREGDRSQRESTERNP